MPVVKDIPIYLTVIYSALSALYTKSLTQRLNRIGNNRPLWAYWCVKEGIIDFDLCHGDLKS